MQERDKELGPSELLSFNFALNFWIASIAIQELSHEALIMTERTIAKQTRELAVDDDSISITSTTSEAYSSDQEFEVERVLAEKTQDGRKYYLVFWSGYPEEKATWEPRKNIQDPAILDVWRDRKMREDRGIVPAFNVTKFNETIKTLEEAKANRHRRRKAKRKRLGIPVSPSKSQKGRKADDSGSSTEAVEADEEPEDDPGMKRQRKSKKPAQQTARKPPPKVKKPFKVLVTGDKVQELGDSSSELEVASKGQSKRKQNDVAKTRAERGRPAANSPSNVFTHASITVDMQN